MSKHSLHSQAACFFCWSAVRGTFLYITNVSSPFLSSKMPSLRTVCSKNFDFSPATSMHSVRLTTSAFPPHVLCVDTGRSSETAKAHRG
eukprot:TRINITY_DN2951_c0_g1_i1.p2 TRINITY_DN2951_c0_g1~~TRINITY_DN2951_c0_g1_i1.p2  ORF type:complete len:89 (+),score=15.50 TRINITY_DN2951_c0_g1_i1:259-525(+)